MRLPAWATYGIPTAVLLAATVLWDAHRDLAAVLFLAGFALFAVGQRFD